MSNGEIEILVQFIELAIEKILSARNSPADRVTTLLQFGRVLVDHARNLEEARRLFKEK